MRERARLQDTSPTPVMASALLLYLFFVGLTALCLALLAQAARWDDTSSQGEVNDVTPSQLHRIAQRQRRRHSLPLVFNHQALREDREAVAIKMLPLAHTRIPRNAPESSPFPSSSRMTFNTLA